MNPLTLAFYAPLILQSGPTLPPHSDYRILHPSDDNASSEIPRSSQWSAIDSKFRRNLPDEFGLRRKTYRAVVIDVCALLVELDGIECERERRRRRVGEE